MEKNQQKLAFWWALLAVLGFALLGCDAAKQTGKDKRKGDKEAASEDDDEGDDDDDKKTTAGEAEGGDDEYGDLEGGEAGGDEDAAEKLNADCGGTGISDQDPKKVIYKKDLESFPITKTQTGTTATIKTLLKIEVSGEKTVQDSNIEVVGQITGLGALLGQEAAKKAVLDKAKPSIGKTTFTNVPFKEYPELSKNKQWDGVLCTFVPATKVVNERGGNKTVATFTPPLPASVSPKAVADRYKEEIGDEREFEDIKVKISESDNPDLKDVSSMTITVRVEKVDAEAEVDDGEGGTKKIKADLAYKITYDADAKKVFALGLPPEVTYYISHSKKDLVANTADTTATGTNGAAVTFIHK